jgi:phosphopantetheinyl transferase
MTDRERALEREMTGGEQQWFRYLLWTRKEAVMKAEGMGLQMDPAATDVLEGSSPSGLCVRSLQLGEKMAAAIADEKVTAREFVSVEW